MTPTPTNATTADAPSMTHQSALSSRWRFTDVLLIALAAMVVLFAGTLGLSALMPSPIVLTLGVSALEVIALIGSVYLFGLKRLGMTWQDIGLRPAPRSWVLVSVALGILCIWLTGFIALLVQLVLNRPLHNPQLQFIAPEGFNWASAIGMFGLAGLAVPFAEELFFRGVLYVWLRDRWGFWVSAIVSALVFGAAHGDVAIAAGTAVLGLIQAAVFEHSRSLWTVCLIHAVNNAFKVALLFTLLAAGIQLS
ncbi:MAG: CPBP family intramembrane metalloprotease [Chloroflexi bacterium]|nr:CPBP family intramembrane metalloprotease [Chloroflexota bacterium]